MRSPYAPGARGESADRLMKYFTTPEANEIGPLRVRPLEVGAGLRDVKLIRR